MDSLDFRLVQIACSTYTYTREIDRPPTVCLVQGSKTRSRNVGSCVWSRPWHYVIVILVKNDLKKKNSFSANFQSRSRGFFTPVDVTALKPFWSSTLCFWGLWACLLWSLALFIKEFATLFKVWRYFIAQHVVVSNVVFPYNQTTR